MKDPHSYNLTRKFAFGAAFVMSVAAAALAWQTRTLAVAQMERLAEDNNANLTQTFANAIWGHFAAFIGAAHTLPPDAIRADPRTAELRRAVGALVANTDVVRVKLYDLGAMVVFSTNPEQIGVPAEDREDFSVAAAGGMSSKLEFETLIDDLAAARENLWVLSSYIPVRNAGNGTIEGVAEVYHDVTEFQINLAHLEQLQIGIVVLVVAAVFGLLLGFVWRADRLIRRQHDRNLELAAGVAKAEAASQAKTEFLANMSHELRTPLNAIIGFSTIIRDEAMGAVGSAKYKEYAGDICSSGEHLLDIINDVLDLVKLEAGSMPAKSEPVNLMEVIGGIVKLTQPSAAAAGLKLVFDADPALRPIESDVTKIRQIAFNLLSNAVKFTANGGIVTVKLWQSSAQRLTRLVVIDNGIGMKEEDLAVALAPFGQVDSGLNRKFEGTGLGLTLSRKLAVTLGGDLKIESRPGTGTTVTVTLPGPMAGAGALLAAAS